MDSNGNVTEQQLLNDSKKLFQHLREHIDDIKQSLNDDRDFCEKEIEATNQYIKRIEEKFLKKTQEYKDKIEQIRQENEKTSATNQKQFYDEIQEINQLFSVEKYHEAWKKFKDCEKRFQQRSTLIHQIPKLHINETIIEQIFSSDYKSTKPSMQPVAVQTSVISTLIANDDEQNDSNMSDKTRKRKEKVIERVIIDKDDKNIEEFNDENHEQVVDDPRFGSRSKLQENQKPTTNGTIENGTKPPSTTAPTRPPYRFSTRLGPTSNSKTLPFSGRITSSIKDNNVHSPENQNQVQSTLTSSMQRSVISTNDGKDQTLTLNPGKNEFNCLIISLYQHERNILLLMACNAQYIILFKSQLNRLDRWHLGVIERRTHIEHSLDWHDGLIISMGYIEKNLIYIFTEREVFIYSVNQRRKLDSRILPRGNDDGSDLNNLSDNESQRGIGTAYDKYIYHIYLNRNSRWTLSKTLLEKLVHVCDYDLTRLFPDVERFIHLCINDKTMNFLVQMNDSSYAVVFCSTDDCITYAHLPPIILPNAHKPLTISSAYIKYFNNYIFFINDPSNNMLHILSPKAYLQSYSMPVHAMCYVADKHELLIVTNNSISSINLNEENLFFSKYSIN